MTRIRLARTTGITSLMAGLAVALAGALAPGPAAQAEQIEIAVFDAWKR